MYTEEKHRQIDLCCRNFFMQVARACVAQNRKCYTPSHHLCNKGPAWRSSSGTWEVSSCDGNQQVRSKTHDTSWKWGRTRFWLQDCWIRISSLPSNLEMLCSPCQLYRLQVLNWGHHLLGATQHLEGPSRVLKHIASHQCFFQEWRPVFRL